MLSKKPTPLETAKTTELEAFAVAPLSERRGKQEGLKQKNIEETKKILVT